MSLLGGSLDILSSPLFNAALFRGFAFCILFVVLWITYGYAFIPLRQVPGPWISRLFPIQETLGRPLRGKSLLNLHQKYGTLKRSRNANDRTTNSSWPQ